MAGGEERVIDDLLWIVRHRWREAATVLERSSIDLGSVRAGMGLLVGGLDPGQVGAAVRRTGARVVSVHNLHPTFGWRTLAAARRAGARVVLHLHNYRLVCAQGLCFNPLGQDCTRCHGRNTLPGVRLGCRGSLAEGLAYGAGLALWQRRILEHTDAIVVPSAAAAERLQILGLPVGDTPVHVVPHVVRGIVPRSTAAGGAHALYVGRLSREKGIDVAIAACARAGLPLVVAGEGPLEAELRASAPPGVRFVGRLDQVALAELRATAGVALVPSRFAETFCLAAAEALAAGVPVVASALGALAELVDPGGLVPPADVGAMAAAARARFGDERVGEVGRRHVAAIGAPEHVDELLALAFGGRK